MKVLMGGRSQGKSVAPYIFAIHKASGFCLVKIANLVGVNPVGIPEIEYSDRIKNGDKMPRGVEKKVSKLRATIFKRITKAGRV